MRGESKYTGTLKVRIEPKLLKQVRERARSVHMDVSTFVRWCILTGLILGDLNSFVRTKAETES